MRLSTYTLSFALGCCGIAFAQSADTPRFEIADVHPSAKAPNAFLRASPMRAGRMEMKNATMLDLVARAYNYSSDKVLGGPNWLELDRFDVIAKVAPDTTPEAQKEMLQSLLIDRFGLVVRKESRPLPTYALTVGKKPQLKEADGSGDTGCKTQNSNAPGGEGTIRMMTMNSNGTQGSFTLGPGMTIQFQCRNMSMAAFAEGLRGMMGAAGVLGSNPILDETGLKGTWNFDVKWSLGMNIPAAMAGDRIGVMEAIEKQLGLKLETRQVPTPVVVVEKVNRKPTENAPEVAQALPPIPVPTEFDVADIKPADPASHMSRFQTQPGGRLVVEGMGMSFLVNRAFNTNNNEEIVGMPSWGNSERFDITAKAPTTGGAQVDMNDISPMMLNLLVSRFKLAYHKEDRQISAYTLVAAKPKMKKADPESRTFCKFGNAPPGAPPATRVITCQNATMAYFAERLQNSGPGLSWPIPDATGLEGGWDFTLTYSMNFPMMGGGPGRGGGDAGPGGADLAQAADPTGGLTIFQALDKQLGLKLETQKRTLPVIVIDHLEQKPTDN